MDGQRRMSAEAMTRGLDCLALFAERLTNIKPDQIRIAGTYTLRRASNAREFVSEAAKVLNHPIEIISGQEEARLIYQGSPIPSTSRARYWWWTLAVAAQSSSSARASITRRSPAARWAASASPELLCQRQAERKAFNNAVLEAQHQLAPIINQYRKLGWQSCLGSSGSIRTVRDVLQGEEWTDGAITWPGWSGSSRR